MERESVAEDAFWQSGRYLRLLIENVDDYAILSLGLDGRITSWNPGAEHVFGWSAEEAIGQPSAMLFTEDDRAAGIPEKERAVAASEGRAEETRWHMRKSRERFWANGVMVGVEDEEGQVLGFTKILRDLTHWKQREEALQEANVHLEQSNRNLEAFASHVAHEMRAPLMDVREHLRRLFKKHTNVLDTETLEGAREAQWALHDLDQFATDLLAYARLEEASEIALEPAESKQALREALADLKLQIEQREAQVTTGDLPQVYANPPQLRHLFRNLIGNAIKYNDSDVPRIEIDAEPGEDAWLFRVRDNGIGISDTDQEVIFSPFRQGDADSERPGAGVGLSLCKRIVEQHGGRIWVESEPRHGSTFLFTLPKRRKAKEEEGGVIGAIG